MSYKMIKREDMVPGELYAFPAFSIYLKAYGVYKKTRPNEELLECKNIYVPKYDLFSIDGVLHDRTGVRSLTKREIAEYTAKALME